MPPKKEKAQKLSYGEFMTDASFGGGSWADEVEEDYGTQPLTTGGDRASYRTATSYAGYSRREEVPTRIPDNPPYLAHLGNLDYEIQNEDIQQFLEGCEVTSIRLIEDRELHRPKGFGYAEFATVDGLKKALDLDGVSFRGRNIKVKVADPPRDRGGFESNRDFSDWSRKGPLPDLPSRGGDRRGPSDFAERRGPPREFSPEDKPHRELNWGERKGPLSPLPQQDRAPPMAREDSRRGAHEGRSDSVRGGRREAPGATWGEGRQEGSRPPRREFSDRPPREPTAAEMDNQWRTNMRPDAPAATPSRSGSEAPPSPAPAAALPASRPKLNLAKRTVSEAPDVLSPALSASGESKASPFGAARPIDSAAREREIEEKRQIALKEKKEAEDKAKEEKRLAKEAAAQEAAEAAETAKAAEAAKAAKAAKAAEAAKAVKAAEAQEVDVDAAKEESTEPIGAEQTAESQNGTEGAQKVPIRPKEPRDHVQNTKTRATESGNWRSASSEQRGGRGGVPSGPRRGSGGPPRGPRHDGSRPQRANGGPAPQQGTQAVSAVDSQQTGPDAEGWETVPNKGRRNQRTRPVVS